MVIKKCPNSDIGCVFEGRAVEIESHLLNQCIYRNETTGSIGETIRELRKSLLEDGKVIKDLEKEFGELMTGIDEVKMQQAFRTRIIKKNTKKLFSNQELKICINCGREVPPVSLNAVECKYHPGIRVRGIYSCCGEQGEAKEGCTYGYHKCKP